MVIQPLSIRLIKPNFCFDLSHRRSTTVSLETRNPLLWLQRVSWANEHPTNTFCAVLIFYILLGMIYRGKGHRMSLKSHATSPTPHSQTKDSHSTAPGSPYSFRIVRGFFYVPPKYQQSRNCEMGPPAYRPYPRRLEGLTICRWKYKYFLLSYFKTLSVGSVGVSNSRPPASQPGTQPSEQPVRGCLYA